MYKSIFKNYKSHLIEISSYLNCTEQNEQFCYIYISKNLLTYSKNNEIEMNIIL